MGTHRDIPSEHSGTCWTPPAGYGHLDLLVRLDLTASFVHRLSPVGAVTHGHTFFLIVCRHVLPQGSGPPLFRSHPGYALELEPGAVDAVGRRQTVRVAVLTPIMMV